MFEGNKRKEGYTEESKLLIAKLKDKINLSKKTNKILYTDFLDISEMSEAKKFLKEEKISNYIIYGVREDADRNIIIFYSEKFSKEMVEKNLKNILQIIRIDFPANTSFEHREILSGIMKLGLVREKFGDIVIKDDFAQIIVLKEVADYLINNLKMLTRFRRCTLELKEISDFENKENEVEELKIIISSNRLDSFVSELAKTSRSVANEYIEQGKVFINGVNEYKTSKKIIENDIITIRGKGKFIFIGIEKETKSGRLLANIKKYK